MAHPTRWPCRTAAFLLGFSLLLGAAGAMAQTQYGQFVLNDDFRVEIDGKEAPRAVIYRSTSVPTILIMTSELSTPVLLVPGSGRVETINVMKLAKKDDGLLDLLPGATLSAEGQFQAEGQGVRFSVAGKTVRLSPRPPLLGLRQATDLKAYSYLYVKGAEEYAPDTAVVAQLKRQAQPVRVRVFFGSWCPHCQRVVPGVVRLAEELASSRIEFEFYGVPQGFKGEPEAEKANVHAVPTGIVYVAGKEVGRIQSDSWSNPERALYGVLNGGGSSGR